MTVDERSRLQLAEALKRALGADEGITLMELLPPVGWADVATRHDVALLRQDLVALEGRIDARFGAIDARFGAVDARFESLEGRFDAKLESLEGRFDAKLDSLEHRLEARFEKGFRQVIVTMMSLLITGFVATVVAVAVR